MESESCHNEKCPLYYIASSLCTKSEDGKIYPSELCKTYEKVLTKAIDTLKNMDKD